VTIFDNEAIKTRRKQVGITLDDLSQGICSASYLSLVENGRREPSMKILNAINQRLIHLENSNNDSSVETSLLKAQIALRLGNFAEGQRLLNEAPVSSRWHFVHGLLAEFQGSKVLAKSSYMKALDLAVKGSPLFLECSLAMTRLLRDIGDIQLSIEIGEAALFASSELGSLHASELSELQAILVGSYCDIGEINRARKMTSILSPDNSLPPQIQLQCLWAKVSVALSDGNYSLAETHARLALNLCKSLDRPVQEAQLRNTAVWAAALAEKSDPNLLLQELMFSEYVLRGTGMDASLVHCLSTKALLLAKIGKRVDFKAATLEIEKLFVALPKITQIQIRIELGYSLIQIGDFDVALDQAENVLYELETVNSNPRSAKLWRDLANNFQLLNLSQRESFCLRKAIMPHVSKEVQENIGSQNA
jgi:transcriptional regulator with XRE-family HTH domain